MDSTTSTVTLDKGKVTLTGAYETLLITLFARAQDARSAHPVLNDQHAVNVVSRITDQAGYDFSRTRLGGKTSASFTRSAAMRGRILDIATEQFLEKHPGPATVLHLACGMDSRSLRVKWQGEGRLWIDADTQDAIGLRRQVMDEPETTQGGEYRMLDPNITEEGWLANCHVPTDRPVFVIFEGLTPYLTADQVHILLRHIVGYFGERDVHGEIRFDATGPVGYFLVNYVLREPLVSMGTRFYYYLSNPKKLEKEVPGLKYTGRMFQMQDYIRFYQAGRLTWLVLMFLRLLDFTGVGRQLGGDYGYKF